MQAYVGNDRQSFAHRNVLQDLMKNTLMGQNQSKKASTTPAPSQAAKTVVGKRLDEVLLKGNAPNLAKDAVTIGREYNITKEEAFNRLNRPYYKMDDSVECGLSVVYQDVENGITNDVDFSRSQIELAYFGPDAIKQDVDYIASRYAAMQERINAEFTGEERTENLNRLDEMLNAAKDKLAQSFSDEMGDFFEENGVSGDKESIYQSVLSAVDQRASQYADFIKANKEYADIGPGEEWLRKDSSYMSSELRKAMSGADTPQTVAEDADGYTLDEMEKLYAFTKELESYSDYGSNPEKALLPGNNLTEESIGMKLAELSLKGMVFNEKAGVSNKVKDIVSKSIQNFISTTIEAEQAEMDKWSSLQIQATIKSASRGAYSPADAEKRIQEIKKAHTAVDKDAIYAVIDKVASSYQKTGDAGQALIDGAVFAKNAFDRKAQNKEYDGIRRYDDESRWDNFFAVSDQDDRYIFKTSGLENMANSWNAFMGKISADSSFHFNNSNYTAMA